MQVGHDNIQVKFEYQGHWVKFKVIVIKLVLILAIVSLFDLSCVPLLMFMVKVKIQVKVIPRSRSNEGQGQGQNPIFSVFTDLAALLMYKVQVNIKGNIQVKVIPRSGQMKVKIKQFSVSQRDVGPRVTRGHSCFIEC